MKAILIALLILGLSIKVSSAQWEKMTVGGKDGAVYSFASSGNYIYVGKGDGAYVSTDGGKNWAQTILNSDLVLTLAINGNYVYAGTDVSGVYVSANNGTTWSQTSLKNCRIYSLAVNGINIFAGTDHGIYLSTNNGNKWKKTSMIDQIIFSLAVDGGSIFAGTGNEKGLYVSNDNGSNWSRSSLPNETVRSISVNGKFIYAATWSNGIFLSVNNGITWSKTSLEIGYDHIYCSAANGNYILAGSLDHGFFLSNDNGATWLQANEGLVKDSGDYQIMAVCIANDYLYGSAFRRPLAHLNENNDSLVFAFRKTECMGKCPAYYMEIYKSGKINFEGKSNVDKIGKFSKQIELKEIENLISEFENAGFFDLENEYKSQILDLPTTYISFTNANKSKTITDYYDAPKKLKDLELLLENIVKSENWLKK